MVLIVWQQCCGIDFVFLSRADQNLRYCTVRVSNGPFGEEEFGSTLFQENNELCVLSEWGKEAKHGQSRRSNRRDSVCIYLYAQEVAL